MRQMLTTSTVSLTLTQPAVAQAVSDCDAIHRFVMDAFPAIDGGRAKLGVLFRLERRQDRALLTVRSRVAPNWAFVRPAWLAQPIAPSVPFDPHAFPTGTRVGFKILVNPTRADAPEGAGDGRISGAGGAGTRVRGVRRAITDVLGVTQWCLKRFTDAGLTVIPDDLTFSKLQWVVGSRAQRDLPRHERRPELRKGAVDVSAVAVVAEGARLADALTGGIGRGKPYGFGLLDLVMLDQ
jgi:CRISPR system Cascade subunit CasE